jgi:hypothetical protein
LRSKLLQLSWASVARVIGPLSLFMHSISRNGIIQLHIGPCERSRIASARASVTPKKEACDQVRSRAPLIVPLYLQY